MAHLKDVTPNAPLVQSAHDLADSAVLTGGDGLLRFMSVRWGGHRQA
jgi:hypothetical protein